jgi:hypothetical protein
VETTGRVLLLAAVVLAAIGVGCLVAARLGFTSLPGSFVWRRGGVTVYAPIGLMILLSLIVTLLMNLRR